MQIFFEEKKAMMKSIRDIYKIGKGPSSSHTMGPAKAMSIYVDEHPEAESYVVVLFGSLADTGEGHGTDKALVAGLLGMKPDDLRIPNSFEIAQEQGFAFHFDTRELRDAHPNTAMICVYDKNDKRLEIQASSLGGGRIKVNKIDGIAVDFSGDYNTLVIRNLDYYSSEAAVTTILNQFRINIANMSMWRQKRGGESLMIIETDQHVSPQQVEFIGTLPGVTAITYYDKEDEDDGSTVDAGNP